ncbi:MAG: response regulator [Spirochaetales bacterium]|nr:response regulator [Spirochaetales bacterium]
MRLKTALIIDDAAVMRMRLRDILEPHFDVVGEAEDGEQALSLYEACRPDFVTLDITMPKVDGITFLQNLLKSHPDAKVIIVSAVGQKQTVFKALTLGARDFVVKPFDPERVKTAANRLFSKA